MPRIAAAPPELAPVESVLAVTEQFVRFVAARPEVTRVMTREGATPSWRLTYLLDRYVRGPFRDVVHAMRAGQRAGLIAADLRPELLLFLLLGAGSHLFDVRALAREGLGIDATSARTRDDFIALLRTLLEQGLFQAGGERRRSR